LIPQAFIQDLLARVDIVEVVGRVVKLRKAGTNFLGLCPFHGEKSPSFTVSAVKQFYHCFGCGAHGSAISFLMEQGGLGYVDAIHELARAQGLDVPQESGSASQPRRDPDVLESLASAARFYKQRLKDSDRAIEYLKGRGVSGETAARFAIGYAPEGWRGLQAAVPDYFAPSLLEAGLVIEPESDAEAQAGPRTDGPGRRRYDRFRDRIMFPIRNPRGQVIGFGGRVLGKGEPKYLNSPETPVFSKGRELYGLFEGREAIRASDCVIVVEGYMDVVMLAQHGVGFAVATLGTATTAQHVQKLLRTADRLVFAFDGDAAGRRAAWRALEACLPHVSDVRRIDFLFLPPEHDPDSFVREQGAAGFSRALETALPLSEFMLGELAARVDLETPEGRARLQADARPLLRAIPPVALRLQLIQSVASRARVRPEDLQQFLADADVPATGSGAWPGRTASQPAAARESYGERRFRSNPASRPPSAPVGATLPDLQRQARLLLSLHPALAAEGWPTEFLPPAVTEWMERLAALPQGASFAGLLESLRQTDPEIAMALQEQVTRDRGLLADLSLDDARSEFEGALVQLRSQGLREAVDELARSGLQDEASRERYARLQEMRRALTNS
jgi:DNA primase